MRYLGSYLLCQLGNNPDPKANDLKKVLDSVGVEADDHRINSVVTLLQGKKVNDLVAEGLTKLVSVSTGGAPSTSSAPRDIAADNQPAAKQNEPKEESDEDMGFGLFD
ncbi:hypothetical protein CAEBREN_11301 [Caenorhabditis brenneri]|uniref:Large ribosomal subunit protein P2 n=1 Tax=Caenorhabditis brenneri TaxID=135651 RepID=G0PKT9_CAEBE|nr:hypothetical protein CAEBREN_11301 [Caenorhabditis brenneri]